MRGLLNNQKLALESVQFQNQNFFKDLTQIYAALKKLPAHEVVGSPLRLELGRTVKRHTGLPVTFDLGPGYGTSVLVPQVDRNHPLLNNLDRLRTVGSKGVAMVDQAGGQVRGTVNLKTGRVSGVYESFEAVLLLSSRRISAPFFSAEELAALTLHEVGHLFVYLEFITRQMSTNQVLAGISKRLDGSDSVPEREAVLTLAKKELHLHELDVQQLAQSKPPVIETVILSNRARQAVSELGSDLYDYSSWEYLADQYAARYGAGRHLVTGLAKMARAGDDIAFRSSAEFLYMEAIKLVWIGIGVAFGGVVSAGTSLLVGPLSGAAIGAWAAKMMLLIPRALIEDDSRGDGMYDTCEARFRRIRNQTVEALKDKRLDKRSYERLSSDLAVIDEILETVHDRRQLFGVLRDLYLTVRTGNPQQRQKQLQQQLEALAANDLFVKAQEFRHVKAA